MWVPGNTKNKYVIVSVSIFYRMSWSTKTMVPTRAGWNINQKQDVTHAAHLPAGDDKQEEAGRSIGIHRTITITNGNYAFNDRVICTTR